MDGLPCTLAFAPVSTWIPALSATRLPTTSHCLGKPFRYAATINIAALLDKSVNSNSTARQNNAQLPEPVDSMHGRLGIQALWLPEQNNGATSVATAGTTSTTASRAFTTSTVSSDSSLDSSTLSHPTVNSSDVPVFAEGDPESEPSVTAMPWDTTTGGGARAISLLDHRFQSVRKRQQLLSRSYDECRRITALFSKTFYMGTSLLSPEKRRAVWAIYTWCRRTDDIVDGPRVQQRSSGLRDALEEWENRLVDIFAGRARDALDLALVDAIQSFPNITPTPFIDMIKGMEMDVEKSRFETFDELYLYCYRVAGTVGLMTLPVMGTRYPGREGLRAAVEPAVALGIALQLTNILRDVGEDRLRGRIYLPLEDLRRFNYSEQDLLNCVRDSRYRNLIKFQIARARGYFRQAQRGVHLLSEDTRFPVQASLDMYSQILDVVEENDYDNFDRRAHITKERKLVTLPVSFLRAKESPSWKPILTALEFLTGTKSRYSSA